MKGNCNHQPASIIEYGKTGTGQVLFNIERNDKEVDGELHENWDFEYVEVDNFRNETVVSAIIRDRYTEEKTNAILANYLEGKGTDEFIELQKVREMAKKVAEGEEHNVSDYNPDIFQINSVKRLLQKVAEPILADEANLTEQDIADSIMLYKQYMVGVTYDKNSNDINEKRFVYKNDLYKVIGAKHTSQSDWTPDTAVSLYEKVRPQGLILPWVQPQGTVGMYQIGEKVTYNDFTWESTAADNVWVPGVYGWVKI